MENFSVNLTWKIFPRRNEPRSSQISNPTDFDVHLFGHCSGHLVAKVNRIGAIRKHFIASFYMFQFQKVWRWSPGPSGPSIVGFRTWGVPINIGGSLQFTLSSYNFTLKLLKNHFVTTSSTGSMWAKYT